MLAPKLPREPLPNWGAVAKEVAKHPFKSGLFDITFGTTYAGIGVATASPIRMGVGMALTGLGVDEMHEFIKAKRPLPALSLH